MSAHAARVTVRTAVAAVLASATLPIAPPAQAAQDDVQASSPLEQVLVTARRREETLQDVPIAMSAFSAENLELRGALDITELQRDTPNLTLQVARGSNSTLIAFIRGVGQQDPLWGFEPGVGLYVDDVYIARPQGAVLDIFEIDRIEVLRGPQGTLYGRNTIGGAVKYVTRHIGDESRFSVRGAVGSKNQADLIVSGATPVGDKFAVGGALATYNRDGFGKNLTTGAEHYNKDVMAGRVSFEFTPTDDLFFRLSADRTEDDSLPKHGYRLVAPSGPTVYDTFAGIGDDNSVVTKGASLLAQWTLSPSTTFKSITAWREGDTRTLIDFDGLPQPMLDIPGFYADEQFSQEFQVLYTGDRWQAVAGVFYLDATAEGAFDTVIGNLNLTTFTAGTVDTESIALFADVNFDITDQLSMSVGGRWTRDEKTADQLRQNYLGLRSPFFGNAAAIPLGAPNTEYKDNSRTFDEFTPRVSFSYKITPDLTTYASWGRGFKSGGFDMRGDAVAYPDTVKGYDSELVTTYELGLKGVLAGRVTFATAVFKSDYEGQQITSQFLIPPATVASFVDNAADSSLWGWELEGAAAFTDMLGARFSVGYVDAQFDEFVTFNPATGQRENLAKQRKFQNTPEWTGSVALDFKFPLAAGALTFSPSASFRDDTQMFEFATPGLDQPSYWLYDASLVWSSDSGRYRFGLHGKNLSDEEYRVGGYNFNAPLTGNALIGFYGPPRTWTANFEVKF